jgi:hypothetical protein
VSLALIVSTIALVAAAGYSGFQEYQVLSGAVSQQSSQMGNNNNNDNGNSSSSNSPSSQFLQFNGTELSMNIPNNMTFPLTIQLSGLVWLAGTIIGNFSTPQQSILPGHTMPISLNMASLDYQKVLSNQSALDSLLFNSAPLTFSIGISADIVPLLGLNLTTTQNTTIPAILGGLNFNPGTPTCTSSGCNLPVGISWNNPSPISFSGNVGVAVTSLPGSTSSSLPSASIPLNVTARSPGDVTANLFFSSSDFQPQNFAPGSQIGLGITFNAFGANVTIPESVTIP